MHAEIVYFSQSGNTRRMASTISTTLEAAGISTNFSPLRRAKRDELAVADLIGIGSPTYNSQAPTPVKRFLASLPSLKGKRAFVFATSGGAPGRVIFDLSQGLRDRGADVVAGFLARGKVSHPCPTIFGRFPDRPNGVEVQRAKEFTTDLIAKVSSNGHGSDMTVRWSRPEAFEEPQGLYSVVGTFASDDIIRSLMPKPIIDENRCHMCRWCMFSCPTSSIKLDPYPAISDATCIRCYRCLTGCPRKSFRISWGGSEKVLELLYSVDFITSHGDVDPDEKIY